MPDARRHEQIPNTRLARGAMLGSFVADQTARYAGTAVANVARGRDRRRVALEKRHLDAADQMLAMLGTMKGPAMKLGQIMSFVDVGILPEEFRPRFQERLSRLCAEAPTISWQRMEPVIVGLLGEPLSSAFSDFDTDPVGAASIGQVYRATTHDGRVVAVKAQYPEMATAARADMKNLAMMLRLGKSLVPSLDTNKLAAELSIRLLEELDYELEARNTAIMSAAYRDHPFICIPAPVPELCREGLLVTEYIEGVDFDVMCQAPQTDRDRAGEVLARFYLGSMCRLGMFSGDPHPGNVKQLHDGRIAVLDFGSFRQLEVNLAERLTDMLGHALLGDVSQLHAGLAVEDFMANPENLSPDVLEDLLSHSFGWLMTDGPVTVDPQVASDAIVLGFTRSGPYAEALHGQDLPVEWTMMARALITTSALLGQLRSTANWNRIGREWVSDEAPTTELGIAEASYFAARQI